MIKAIVFDADGMVIVGGRFSRRLARDYGISTNNIDKFFETDSFGDCKIGKADLKKRIKPYLEKWGWKGTIDEFLDYWFSSEYKLDREMVSIIDKLRQGGVKCYLATDQEKYRTNYIINDMGLGEVFDAVVSSVFVGYKKTEPEFYPRLFEIMKKDLSDLEKNEVLFWDHEDKKRDQAEHFGFETMHYENLNQFKEALTKRAVL